MMKIASSARTLGVRETVQLWIADLIRLGLTPFAEEPHCPFRTFEQIRVFCNTDPGRFSCLGGSDDDDHGVLGLALGEVVDLAGGQLVEWNHHIAALFVKYYVFGVDFRARGNADLPRNKVVQPDQICGLFRLWATRY